MSARTITARIDPQAITRVTRFFNAGLRQTLEELLQNARRSGATEVDIWVDGDLLTIADDGTGIDDPSSLLAFGASTWNDEAVQREDPAGMGVYALAPRPCAIASKAAEGDGWRVALEPKHFRGDAPAVIEPCAMPERGTAVTLTLLGGETEQTVKDVVEAAGRHHPLPIVFNGNPVEREDFLRGSAATTEWEGVRIGVFADGTRATLNFHGIEIRLADAPYVRTMERGWSAAVDVIDAPGLELTLPARQELVQNDFARRLRKRMHKAIYETLAAMRPPPQLPYASWREARSLLVDYPAGRRLVTQWRAEEADEIPQLRRGPQPTYEAKPNTHLLMTHVWETSITGLIEAAAREHGVLTRLVAPNDHHAGYTWYDQLTHVAEVRVEAKLDGTEWSWDPQKEDPRATDVPEGPVETIEVVLVGKGEKELLRLPLDFCFLNQADEVSDVDSIEVLVRRGARLKASTVCDEIMRSYFSPCEDVSSDSYTTQRENWRNKAWAKAVAVTEGDEAAHLAELENAAAALQVAQRAGETVVARVTDEGVNVEIVKGRNDNAERTRSAREGRQPRRTNP